jgi:hypothetical protein
MKFSRADHLSKSGLINPKQSKLLPDTLSDACLAGILQNERSQANDVHVLA